VGLSVVTRNGKGLVSGFPFFLFVCTLRVYSDVLSFFSSFSHIIKIPQSLVYATLLTMAGILPSLPFSFYSTFVIEQRHGFNKSTVGLWIMDQLKGWVVGAVVGLPVLAAFLAIAGWAGKGFVAWLMAFL
jgi:Zn-dependent protease with chaperone function